MPNNIFKIKLGVDIRSFTSNMRKVGKEMGGVFGSTTTTLLALTGAAVGLTSAIVAVGVAFEMEMKAVRAVSKATAVEFLALEEAARKIGKTTQYTSIQAAQGLKFLAMAGMDANKAIKALPGVVDLATIGFMDLGLAADIATNVLTAYGLEVNELNNVNDILAQMATTSNTTIEEAAQAFKFAAPLARTFKMSVADTAVVFGLLANSGVRGTQAGTTLAQMMRKLGNTTRQTEPILKKYNLTIRDSTTGAMKPFLEVIKEFTRAGMSAEEAAKVLGVRASLMQAVFARGITTIEEYEKTIKAASGASKEMADMIRTDFSYQIVEIKSKLQDLAIVVYKNLKPHLSELATKVTDIVSALDTWFSRNHEQVVEVLARAFKGLVQSVSLAWEWFNTSLGSMATYGIVGALLFGTGGAAIFATLSVVNKAWSALKKEFVDITDDEVSKQGAQKVLRGLDFMLNQVELKLKAGMTGMGRPYTDAEMTKMKAEQATLKAEIRTRTADLDQLANKINKAKSEQADLNVLTKDFYTLLGEQKRARLAGEAVVVEAEGMYGSLYGGNLGNAAKAAAQTKAEADRAHDALVKTLDHKKATMEDAMAGYSRTQSDLEDQLIHQTLAKEKAAAEAQLKIWEKYQEEKNAMQNKAAKDYSDFLTSATNSLGTAMTQMQQGLMEGSVNIKQIFGDMAKAVVAELWKIFVVQKIVGLISGAIGSMGGGMTAQSLGTSGYGNTSGAMAVGFHQGGVVGETNAPSRLVNTAVFANAKRYHGGGKVPGIGPSEVPAILQTGETVVPRGGSMAPIINNYNDFTGSMIKREEWEAGLRQQNMMDATRITEQNAPGAVQRDYKRDGPTRQMIRGAN